MWYYTTQLLSQRGEDDAIVNEKLGLQESEFWFKSVSHLFSHLAVYPLVLSRNSEKEAEQWASARLTARKHICKTGGGSAEEGGRVQWWLVALSAVQICWECQSKSSSTDHSRRAPTAAQKENLTQKHTCTAGESATSQRPRTKKTRQRRWEGKSDQIHTEKEVRKNWTAFFLRRTELPGGARGSSRFYFWSPFNNLSPGSCRSAEHNFAFFKSFDMQVWIFFFFSHSAFLNLLGNSNAVFNTCLLNFHHSMCLYVEHQFSEWVGELCLVYLDWWEEKTHRFVCKIQQKLNFACQLSFITAFTLEPQKNLKMLRNKNDWGRFISGFRTSHHTAPRGTLWRDLRAWSINETYLRKQLLSGGDSAPLVGPSGWLAVPAAAGRGCSN